MTLLLALVSLLATMTPSPARATPVLRFGMSFAGDLPYESPAQLDATFRDLRQIGVGWVREQAAWSVIEASRGRFDWSGFDRVVAAARRARLSLVVVLRTAPNWARSIGCLADTCPPADPAAFAQFASRAVHRYARSGVHTWEIWNEPNVARFWSPAANASAYARLLATTSTAIHRADSRALVISGGLAPARTGNGDIDPRSFIAAACSSGALGRVQAVGVHPYSAPAPPGDPADWSAWTQMSETSPSVRSVLRDCGRGSLPLWATEYGAPTAGPGLQATEGNWRAIARLHPDHVDEDYQATLATDAVHQARRLPWLQALFWYGWRDRGTARTDPENFFGLRRHDGSKKPAWSSLRSALGSGGRRG